MVSHVSVMPMWSIPLLVTMFDRAGALSRKERTVTVPEIIPVRGTTMRY